MKSTVIPFRKTSNSPATRRHRQETPATEQQPGASTKDNLSSAAIDYVRRLYRHEKAISEGLVSKEQAVFVDMDFLQELKSIGPLLCSAIKE